MQAALHPAWSHCSDPSRLDCARCGAVLSGTGLDCRSCSTPGQPQRRFRLLGPVLIAACAAVLLHLIAVTPASYWDGGAPPTVAAPHP